LTERKTYTETGKEEQVAGETDGRKEGHRGESERERGGAKRIGKNRMHVEET